MTLAELQRLVEQLGIRIRLCSTRLNDQNQESMNGETLFSIDDLTHFGGPFPSRTGVLIPDLADALDEALFFFLSKNPPSGPDEPDVDDPCWLQGFVPRNRETGDWGENLYNPVLRDLPADFDQRPFKGLCSICGTRFGRNHKDYRQLRRMESSPGFWEHPTWEWIGPCGHRVR